jgi:hypothetical protein
MPQEGMTAREVEDLIWEKEGFRVIIRAKPDEIVGTYADQRKSSDTISLTKWEENRFSNIAKNYFYVIVDGRGGVSGHGRTLLRNLRASYMR